MSKTNPEQNKALVLKAFDTLFNKRDYAAAERCRTLLVGTLHPAQRPHCAGPQRSVQLDPHASGHAKIREPAHCCRVAEGDDVIAHGRFSGNGRPASWSPLTSCASRMASSPSIGTCFRTRRPKAESVSGLPMFGDRFPD